MFPFRDFLVSGAAARKQKKKVRTQKQLRRHCNIHEYSSSIFIADFEKLVTHFCL